MKPSSKNNPFSDMFLLQTLCQMDILDSGSVFGNIDEMTRQAILKKHPHPITQYADGRWKTYVEDPAHPGKRKQIAKASREEVEKAIVHHAKEIILAHANQKITMQLLYEEWMHYRIRIGTSPKTLAENKNEWNRFISEHTLAKMQVTKVDAGILEDFFFDITKNHAITQKRMVNVKTVLNGMFKRAKANGVLATNPMDDVDFAQYRNRYKTKNTSKDNYSQEERDMILNHLKNETGIYELAISLAFYLCLRIGELTVLKKEDYHDGVLSIHRSVRRVQEMRDDLSLSPIEYQIDERIKGNTADGFRDIPLTPKAISILEKVIARNPTGEFLFMNKGKPINGSTFNDHLKRICNELGIKYRSSHQIRFTTATMFYEAGIPVNQISTLLGHSDTRTTFGYIRKQRPDDASKELMKNVLD